LYGYYTDYEKEKKKEIECNVAKACKYFLSFIELCVNYYVNVSLMCYAVYFHCSEER